MICRATGFYMATAHGIIVSYEGKSEKNDKVSPFFNFILMKINHKLHSEALHQSDALKLVLVTLLSRR